MLGRAALMLGKGSLPFLTTFNPADKNAGVVLASANLRMTNPGGTLWGTARTTRSKNAGKWYYEFTHGITNTSGGRLYVGAADATASLNNFLGSDTHGVGIADDVLGYATAGNVVGVGLDLDADQIRFQASGGGTSGPTALGAGMTGTALVFPAATVANVTTAALDFNGGNVGFVLTPFSGFAAWDSA